ncbi:MAG: hypothetical protein NZ742_09880 [Acidobacteria bacterium]|nr:hypothetical protein [Acidobacteriota bacterium]MDW7985068.1 hypothetical protein [Acidobacteriota bacterium]
MIGWLGLAWLTLGVGLFVLARRMARTRFFVERLDFQIRQWLEEVRRDQQKSGRLVEALFWDRLYQDRRVPITPFMPLDEVLRVLPSARGVLEARNVRGRPASLAWGVETLLDVAVAYDLDLSALMNELLQATPSTAPAEGTEAPIMPVIRPRSSSS